MYVYVTDLSFTNLMYTTSILNEM